MRRQKLIWRQKKSRKSRKNRKSRKSRKSVKSRNIRKIRKIRKSMVQIDESKNGPMWSRMTPKLFKMVQKS